jgi:phosphatidylinositol alpha-mannosyltransferase
VRIGMVCPYDWSYPGGVRSHVVGLASALGTAGHGVEVLAPASSTEPDIFVTGGSLGIPFNGSVARLCFSPGANARIRKRLGAGDLDLLHLHEPGIPSVSMLALRQANVPVIATFHASAPRSLAYQVARPILRPMLERISQRVAVSEASKRLISSYFPGDYHLIPNGIDFRRFSEAEPDRDLMAAKPFVLFVGRPEARKGLPVAVEALRQVRARYPVEMVAVGPSAEDVPGWVRALGPVPHDRLPGIYKAADVFCAPSLGGESFGIVLAEAMASGTPVVCSDIPGYVEAAAGAALHAPVGDAEATADLIAAVLSDPSRAASLVALGRERARELDWGVLSSRILNLYQAAVS